MHYLYLQKLRLKNYSDKAENFQLFDLDYNSENFGFEYIEKDKDDESKDEFRFDKIFTEYVHYYFETHSNCFTLLPGSTEQHFLTIFVHKNDHGIHIYVIDSNSSPYSDCIKLQKSLKDHFQEKHPKIHCESYYMGAYNLNFGGENDNIFENEGYCQLIGYLFMYILYRNIVIYNKLPFNASQLQVFDFINSMKKYCTKYFKDSSTPNDELWKFKVICYNFDYRVMKAVKLINTNENATLDGNYYKKFLIDDRRNFNSKSNLFKYVHSENDQNKQFNFKSKIREFILSNQFMLSFIGINWQSDPDFTAISQKDNDYYFFVPEIINIWDTAKDSDICYFKGINTDMHFEVENEYTWAKVDKTQSVNLNNVNFLFFKANDFTKDTLFKESLIPNNFP